MHRSIAIALIGLAAQTTSTPPPSPGAPSAPTPLPVPGVERVEVRLAQFDVIVKDKAGRFINGLSKENFSVVEDGVPLEIVAVDEWGATRPPQQGPPPTSPTPSPGAGSTPEQPAGAVEEPRPEPRSIVLVFDALGASTALRMSQAKLAAQRFVKAHAGPDDLFAVYQLDLSLRAMSGLSSRPEDIAKAIDRVSWMPASSLQDDISESVLAYNSAGNNPIMQERLTGMSALATSQLDWQRNHVYESLEGLAPIFEGLPGKRILVLASPGFPMTTAGDLRQQLGGFTPKFQSLVRTLSRLGVTAYTLDIGADLALGDAGEKIDWRIAVGKMGMDENILSDLGLERSMGTAGATARREFLGVLAGESGGRMLTSTDLTRDFETIQDETTHFYRVACRVKLGGANRYRRTIVKVDVPGASVSSRRGRYGDVTPLAAPARDEATTAETLQGYRPVSARGTALPLPSADPRKIPLAVVIEAVGPLDIATTPEGAGAIDVEFRLVARAAGEIVARYEHSFTAKVRREGIGAMRGSFRVEGRLTLVPGLYEIQGSLRLLNPPQLATWTSTVAVPPLPSGATIAIAGACLVGDDRTESPLISRPDIAPEADPLALKDGTRVLPSTSADFDTGGAILVVGWLRGVPIVDGKPALELGFHVLDANEQLLEVPIQLLQFAPESTGGFRTLARVDTRSLPPGSYRLRVDASMRSGSSAPARRTLPFVLHARLSGESATASSAP